MSEVERLDRMERFEVALSLELGIPMSSLKDSLTAREYDLYYRYFLEFGIGQEAEYVRSANQIITIANYITGAVGGKPKSMSVEDIYAQLSYGETKKNSGNNLVDWDNTPEHLKKQFIASGMFDEEGNPIARNPHI